MAEIEYKYNTQREELIMPEYGRNLQVLVNKLLEIEDKKERTKFAEGVIKTMANLNPNYRNTDEYKQKLWDHLTIISRFQLDVDTKYSLPRKEDIFQIPNDVPYCNNRIRYKHYGKTVELMIEEAIEMKDDNKKKLLIQQIANHMKRLYITWNKDRSVGDDIIYNDLLGMSKGKLQPDDSFKLADSKKILKPSQKTIAKKNSNGNNKNLKNKKRKRK